MILKSIFKKLSVGLVLSSAILLSGCFDSEYRGAEQEATFKINNKIDQKYAKEPRLKRIIHSLGIYNQYGGHCTRRIESSALLSDREVFACIINREYYKEFLIDNLEVYLSKNLPENSVVQIFKDRIILNAFLAEDTQYNALKLAIDYMQDQERDLLEYGLGERFTISNGSLIDLGKEGTYRDKFLVPAL